MPVSNLPLILEKRYPYQKLQGFTLGGNKEQDLGDDVKIRNSWYSWERNAIVYVVEDGGKIFHVTVPEAGGKKLGLWFNTMQAAEAWTVEMELRALGKLKEMIRSHLYNAYFHTGTFIEMSKKTGITYVFRRLRPTIALTSRMRLGLGEEWRDDTRILTILCLHPLGYYGGSWGGVMCPTDDVIAHLTLMRGDEAYFWRKANHHPSYSAEGGL